MLEKIKKIFLLNFVLLSVAIPVAFAQVDAVQQKNNVAENATQVLQEGAANAVDMAGMAYKKIRENENIPKYMHLSSMMFTKKEINYVEQALYAHNNSIPIEMVLPEVFPPQRTQNAITKSAPKDNFSTGPVEGEEKQVQALTMNDLPNFFLRSILYFSPDEWVIWLNGKKITPTTVPEDIAIEKVEEGRVKLRWMFKEFSSLLSNMTNKCTEINVAEVMCAGEENNIVINKAGQFATFTLFPNQTFVGYAMAIEEGDVKKNDATAPVAAASADNVNPGEGLANKESSNVDDNSESSGFSMDKIMDLPKEIMQ